MLLSIGRRLYNVGTTTKMTLTRKTVNRISEGGSTQRSSLVEDLKLQANLTFIIVISHPLIPLGCLKVAYSVIIQIQ